MYVYNTLTTLIVFSITGENYMQINSKDLSVAKSSASECTMLDEFWRTRFWKY